jgi:hypothetical protein
MQSNIRAEPVVAEANKATSSQIRYSKYVHDRLKLNAYHGDEINKENK